MQPRCGEYRQPEEVTVVMRMTGHNIAIFFLD
jgi:hypothetical protein